MFRPKKQDGFTLLDLIIVVVILGILAAVAIPRFHPDDPATGYLVESVWKGEDRDFIVAVQGKDGFYFLTGIDIKPGDSLWFDKTIDNKNISWVSNPRVNPN